MCVEPLTARRHVPGGRLRAGPGPRDQKRRLRSRDRLELCRRLGDGCRPDSRSDRPRAGRRGGSPGARWTRRADGIAQTLLDARARPAGQGRALPDELPRVPRVDVRDHESRHGPGEHQLPLRRGRALLPLGQRRRRVHPVPRLLHRARRGAQTTSRQGARAGSGSTTARGTVPTGPSHTRRRPRARQAGPAHRGGAAETTSTCCTREGPQGCRRASCGARTTCSPG